ncbi:MAG: redoxin domain-containing protein [Phycisphaerales bacterium]
MDTRHSAKVLITLAAAASILPALAFASAPEIKREVSAQRDALDAMETKSVDTAAFASLTDWTHPGTLSDANIDGKVVIVAMISTGEPKSYMTLSKLTRMQRDFGENEVVVAAIHPDAGWDAMQAKLAEGRITVPVARDQDGVFAAAMHTDDFPDIYVIDRAGQVRFADVDERSLKAAVKQLTSESTETAITNAELQSQGLDPVEATAVAAGIDKLEYDNAPWPNHNGGRLTAINYQGQPLPVPMGKEQWVTEKKDLEGKVLVLDFWATWCPPCRAAAPILEEMQDSYGGRLEIVGIGGNNEGKDVFVKYVKKKQGNYTQLFDKRQTLYRAMGVNAIPHVVVLSTDGVIRWQGNPLSPDFKQAVAMTIAADPMLAGDN